MITEEKIRKYYSTYPDFSKERTENGYPYLTPRKVENRVKQELIRYNAFMKTLPVKDIEVDVEWTKSNNVMAEAVITYIDGSKKSVGGYHAGGWGYDKVAQVLNTIVNENAIQNLLLKHSEDELKSIKDILYNGAGWEEGALYPKYDLRGGKENYYNLVITHPASGKSYDKYVITFTDVGMAGRRITAPRKRAAPKKTSSPRKQCPVKVDFRKML